MYASPMKRLQILIDEDLDEALAALALEERTSKAALIRRFVRERIKPLPPMQDDPLWQMVGMAGNDVEPARHDDVVYPR